MSKRLASFNGPSTPSASPVQVRQQPSVPNSPSRTTEATYHRKVRTLLQEIRTIAHTWDELVKIDGLKAATTLTDTRTDLDNILRPLPKDTQPCSRIVGPRLAIMDKCIYDLDAVVAKLKKQFSKLHSAMVNLEEIVFEAHRTKGWAWVHSEPLWCTWTLEMFATKIPNLVPSYHRSLELLVELVDSLRNHSLSFDASRRILEKWVSQSHLEEDEWAADWEDLCSVEVEKWYAR